MLDGLLLTLSKRRMNALDSKLVDSSFLVWGYFDILTIKKVSWNGFVPHSNNMENDDIVFSNEFQIKLINSHSSIDFSKSDSEEPRFEKRPLLSCVLLHFTQQALKEQTFEDTIKTVSAKISTIFDQYSFANEDDRPIFAVYPSLGFMDAVIICRSNNFSTISNMVYTLRSYENLLESSYMLPAISFDATKNTGMDAWRNCSLDNNTRFSIRATLKPGASTKKILNVLRREIESLGNPELEINYEMFGNSDILLLPQTPASRLASLYFAKGAYLLQPPYKHLIANTRTSVRVLAEKTVAVEVASEVDSDQATEADKERMEFEKDICRSFNEQFSSRQNSIVENNIISDRLKVGMFSLLKYYFDITSSSHTFDIRKMLDPAIGSFMKCLSLADRNKDIDKFNESLSEFRVSFHSVISDFSRADRHLLEGRWLRHPAVGSSCKLIMVYHTFITKIVNTFRPTSTYTFLPTSGRVDCIQADILFRYILPVKNADNTREEHRLFILRIPEDSLFNVPDTMFRISHEVFHFVGRRMRVSRNESTLNSLAAFMGISFDNQFYQSFFGFGRPAVNPANRNIADCYKNMIDDEQKHYVKAISEACCSEWTKALESDPPDSEYSYHWVDKMYEIIGHSFSDGLYDTTKSNLCTRLEKINEDFYLLGFGQFMKISNSIIPRDQRDEGKSLEKCLGRKEYLPIMQSKNKLEELTRIHIYHITGSKYENKQLQKELLNTELMLEILVESYKEAFSDMCSITLLNTPQTSICQLFTWAQIVKPT